MPTASRKYVRKPPLKESHPHLFAQLLPHNNIGIDLDRITSGSGKRLNWTCTVCSHEWVAKVNDRSYYNSECPNCSANKARTPPLYIARYDVFKELTVPDSSLRTASPDRVSWTCATCEHQWEVRVQQRTYFNTRCPQCVRVDLVGTSKLEYRFLEVLKNHPDVTDITHGKTLDQKFESGRKMTVDFEFTHVPTGALVYLEIDGKRWHSDEPQVILDTYKTKTLLETSDAFVVRTRNDGLPFLEIEHERLIQLDFKWTTQEKGLIVLIESIIEFLEATFFVQKV